MDNRIHYGPNIYNPLFKQEIIDDAVEHAKEEWPNEACGAVINDEYFRYENLADDKSESFLIQDKVFNREYVLGNVQAVIHSHDDFDKASLEDQTMQVEMDIPFGIINLKHKSLMHIVFWGRQVPIAPLEGRFFFFGSVFDCYSLVSDYYRLQGYEMPFPPRKFPFWVNNISMFEEYLDKGVSPFYKIDLKDVKPGDVLLYSIHKTKYLNHCGVLLEKHRVLHHFYNSISRTYDVAFHGDTLRSAMRFDPKYKSCGKWWEK